MISTIWKGGDVECCSRRDEVLTREVESANMRGLFKMIGRSLVYFNGAKKSSEIANLSMDFIERAQKHEVALAYELPKDSAPVNVRPKRTAGGNWNFRKSQFLGVFRESVGYGAIYEAARILTEFREELAANNTLTFNPGTNHRGSDINYDNN